MKAFDRQPPPAFFLVKAEKPGNKLHGWSEQRRTLAEWFHDTVRPAGEGALCAYCDGLFDTQSPRTIDHWISQEACPALALWWWNLFPACYGCQMAKGTKWPVSWLRPDEDEVEALIECDLASGRLDPAGWVRDEALRKRIQDTIDGLGLNRRGLVRERWRILSDLYSRRSGAIESLLDRAAEGPYRFLAPRVTRPRGAP